MTLSLLDAHCHLDPGYFPEGADAVMERAGAAGVVGLRRGRRGQGSRAGA